MATSRQEMCMKICVVTKDNMPAVNMSDETRRDGNTMGNVTTIRSRRRIWTIATTIVTTIENTTARKLSS